MPDCFVPVEGAGRRRHTPWRIFDLPGPQYPGGKYAVEQRLYQGRAEECCAALALEADSERLLQRRNGQRPMPASRRQLIYAGESVAGIGGEEPGEVLGFEKSGIVGQRSAEILTQTGANLTGEGAGLFKQAVEVFGAARRAGRSRA